VSQTQEGFILIERALVFNSARQMIIIVTLGRETLERRAAMMTKATLDVD